MRLPTLRRRSEPVVDDPFLEPGTRSSIGPAVSDFWDALSGQGYSPRLLDRVWSASRCLQLNAQQIAKMPLRFTGTYEPSWVSSPDPVYYPNGISDAVFAIVASIYAYGDAFLYVTSRYANGFPQGWTVLQPQSISVTLDERGERAYRSNEVPLDPDDVVQITRNPTGALRGTGALRAFAPHLYASIAASDLNQTLVGPGAVPNAVLKSQRKLTEGQAEAIQAQWVTRTALRRGAPAILPPEIDFEQLAFSPKDLLLLDAQQFDARVICAAFGVPSFLLNIGIEGGGLLYQNPETLMETWFRVELAPVAGRISSALSATMLPRGASVSFDPSEALQPTFAELVTSWTKLLASGVVSVDEVRAVVGLPPEAQGDALDQLTQPPAANVSGATGEPAAVVQQLRPLAEGSTA